MGTTGVFGLLMGTNALLDALSSTVLAPAGRRLEVASIAFLLNLVTWPLATIALLALSIDWWGVEVLVVVAEAVGYRLFADVGTGRAISLSLFTNFVTVLFAVTAGTWW